MMMQLSVWIGAGLVIRSFVNLLHVDTGFNPQNLVTMQVTLPDSKYHDPQRQSAFCEELVERISGLPGVTAAAATSYMPLTSLGSATIWVSSHDLRSLPELMTILPLANEWMIHP